MNPEIQQPAGDMASHEGEAPKCLTDGCSTKSQWKGLCASCYGVAKKLIEKKETTWEELVQLRLAKVDVKPFEAAFRKAKELWK